MASGFQAVFATKTQMWSVDTNMDPAAAIVQSKRDGEANGEYRISDSYQKTEVEGVGKKCSFKIKHFHSAQVE